MISILIPVYNTFVYQLVKNVSHQLITHSLHGEIIVLDDFSREVYREQNRSLSILPGVIYKELDANQGRVAIRKLLSSSAQYEWLLFIDGDSILISKDYLHDFYQAIREDVDVIQGGRVYASEPPADCNKRLHWEYGRKRESIIGKVKGIFHSNNFCIRKSMFEQLTFPEELTGYGHEDTWMGIQLEKLNAKFSFIANPVLHEGIETSDIFIRKSIDALHNLLKLSEITSTDLLKKHVRLFSAYCQSKKFRLDIPILLFFKSTKKLVVKNLYSCSPSLLLFDCYRLGRMIEIDRQQNR